MDPVEDSTKPSPFTIRTQRKTMRPQRSMGLQHNKCYIEKSGELQGLVKRKENGEEETKRGRKIGPK